MSLDLSNTLVIGISSRALFDLEKENDIYENEGVDTYQAYQVEHENVYLEKGTAFYLIESLLKLNEFKQDRKLVEVVK